MPNPNSWSSRQERSRRVFVDVEFVNKTTVKITIHDSMKKERPKVATLRPEDKFSLDIGIEQVLLGSFGYRDTLNRGGDK